MSSVRVNIAVNFLGRGANVFIALLFFPIYLRILGADAFGLIGIYNALSAVLGLLDLGIGATILREMARLSASSERAQEQRDLLRTAEAFFLVAMLTIGLATLMVAPFVGPAIKSAALSPGTIASCVALMGCTIALQLPFNLYQNAINGLERQTYTNFLLVSAALLRGVGALLILIFVSPTVEAFFAWQLVASAVALVAAYCTTWQLMPNGRPATVTLGLLKKDWRYSGTVALNGIVAVILAQVDKFVIAMTLPLTVLGYYTLGGTVASLFWSIILPLNTALFPLFVRYSGAADRERLSTQFHRGSQLMTWLILPPAVTATLFPRELILAWTGDPTVANEASVIVALLCLGTAINGLVSVSSSLQSALGYPRFMLYTGLLGLVLIFPLMFLLIGAFGAVGAAVAWVGLNCLVAIVPPILFHRLELRSELWRWYLFDLALPIGVGAVIGLILRFALPVSSNRAVLLLELGAVAAAVAIAVGIVCPAVRQGAKQASLTLFSRPTNRNGST